MRRAARRLCVGGGPQEAPLFLCFGLGLQRQTRHHRQQPAGASGAAAAGGGAGGSGATHPLSPAGSRDDAMLSKLIKQDLPPSMFPQKLIRRNSSQPPVPKAKARAAFRKMYDTVRQLHSDGWVVGPITATTLLKFTADHHLGHHSLVVCDWIETTGIPVEESRETVFMLDSIAMRALVLTGDEAAAEAEAHCKHVRWKHAFEGLSVSVLTPYAIVLMKGVTEEVRAEGVHVYNMLLRRNTPLHIALYTGRVTAMRSGTEIVRLVADLQRGVCKAQRELDEPFYTAVIRACAGCGALQEAGQFFNEALARGFSGSSVWAGYLGALCAGGSLQGALQIFQRAPPHYRKIMYASLVQLTRHSSQRDFPFAPLFADALYQAGIAEGSQLRRLDIAYRTGR